jgi:predicted ATPase/DNA-binding XRE family transcriptional regulator
MSSGPSPAFGPLLRERRRAAGLTQDELARASGVGVRTLRDLEQGRAARPQRSTVDLLATALGLTGPEREEFEAAARGRRAPGGRPETTPRPIALPPVPELIGRDAELADLAALLAVGGLITLVGLAGVGKTGLALAVAHRTADRYPGGVGGVSVTDVATEADLLATAASVFGVARATDLPERFGGQPALLLLDGVERSPEAAAAALAWLRTVAPHLRVLATSRHPIGLPGEHQWPVAPLEVPGPDVDDPVEIFDSPAVALFLDRLRQVRQHPVAIGEAGTLAALVHRLGGLPLALELAAARGRVLELPEILARYGDRVLDLGDGDGSQPLREAVTASYRLLEPADQTSLAWLSAFHARWSLELAEDLLAGVPGGAPGDVVALVDRLVALGLVNVRPAGPEFRFRLLSVVRDYALEQAVRAGIRPAARARHAAVIEHVAAGLAPLLAGPARPAAVVRLDYLASDIRAALEYSREADPRTALSLAARLPAWWRYRGRRREGREWLRRLLADPRTAGADPILRAWAQLGVAQLGPVQSAIPVPESVRVGSVGGVGSAGAEVAGESTSRIGLAQLGVGQPGPGSEVPDLELAEAALATFVARSDRDGELAARWALTGIWAAAGGYTEARAHAVAILALAGEAGDVRQVALARAQLAGHDLRTADLSGAGRRLTAVLQLAGEAGDPGLRAAALAGLAEVARLDRRYTEALVLARQAAPLLAAGDAGQRGRQGSPVTGASGDPGQRARLVATAGLAAVEANRWDEVDAALAELAAPPGGDGPTAAGLRALIRAYAARRRGGDPAEHFAAAVTALRGRPPGRELVEALVGLVVSTPPEHRGPIVGELDAVCGRGALTLLDSERDSLRRAGYPR